MLCGMKDYCLPETSLRILRIAHKGLKDRRKADRIKAVYLLGKGWPISDVKEALLLDEDTIRNYYARYEDSNLMGLTDDKYIGNKGLLGEREMEELEGHLEERTYRTAKEVMHYIKSSYDVEYSLSGVHELLKRLGFVYKKPQRCPAKFKHDEQIKFLKKYAKLSKSLGKDDSIMFMDTTHPQHQTHVDYGWIKRGETKTIFTTATQPRLNINGALDIKRLKVITHFQNEMVSKESVKDFLELFRKKQPKGWIFLICDKAGYYHNDDIKAYAKSMAIKMIYLPSYSPNLNLIERLWLFFKKEVLYNKYFETFARFEEACRHFFATIRRHRPRLQTLLTENFQRLHAS